MTTNTNGTRRKMFPLDINGVEIRTLEELRDNFDLETVVGYFKTGELLTWLENRFYDDEADAIAEIHIDDRNAAEKICAALNVDCDTDLEFTQRLREKKSALAQLTDDEKILDNAAATALNQEDLATLIQMDYKTIYLCGENFNVPIRVSGVKYVGILSTPKIKIRAQTQADLDAKNISFVNVRLPWQKTLPIDELKAFAEKIFQTGGKWPVVKSKVSLIRDAKSKINSFDQLSNVEKSAALRMICQGNYSEQQIAYLQLTDDFSSGFALTVDSFCTGGTVGGNIIPYKEIKQAVLTQFGGLSVSHASKSIVLSGQNLDRPYNSDACLKLFKGDIYDKLANFLEVAKNF